LISQRHDGVEWRCASSMNSVALSPPVRHTPASSVPIHTEAPWRNSE
jgi:hypothetical protein